MCPPTYRSSPALTSPRRPARCAHRPLHAMPRSPIRPPAFRRRYCRAARHTRRLSPATHPRSPFIPSAFTRDSPAKPVHTVGPSCAICPAQRDMADGYYCPFSRTAWRARRFHPQHSRTARPLSMLIRCVGERRVVCYGETATSALLSVLGAVDEFAKAIIRDPWGGKMSRGPLVLEPTPLFWTPRLRRLGRPERSPGCPEPTHLSSAVVLSNWPGCGRNRSRGSLRTCRRSPSRPGGGNYVRLSRLQGVPRKQLQHLARALVLLEL